ncbi:hypothetical protein EIP91_001411 [Steccherinum ochraceum]|uniref:Cytochrome P450 n=1 Tax=Steccherinum ochraceum TaxID=92696 RepID=A0A4R0RE23_9APHY|nr:hypothetical protein EIP91_001411 [Steccherinum ochraceum]
MDFVFALLIATLAIIVTWQAFQRSRHTRHPTSTCVDTMNGLRSVLENPNASLQTLLVSRAGSNSRLRASFQLTNTFVSDDPHLHREFVTKAKGFVQAQASSHSRAAFADMCSAIVEEVLAAGNANGHPVAFDDFIQVVTFKVILSSLFGAEIDGLDDGDVLFAARAINTLWQQSKQAEPPSLDLLCQLNSHLRSWLPEHTNPLDFIVPAYETMWRVVAIAVARVHRDGSLVYQTAFSDFLQDPSRGHFQRWNSVQEPSIESVIQETIRLYPPTRRISRLIVSSQELSWSSRIFRTLFKFPFSAPTFPAPTSQYTAIVDIGALHRDPTIWGPDSDVFDPLRFHSSRITSSQKECMLGFGFGRLKCVAKDWAPHTAAIIVAAVLSRTCGEVARFKIVEGEKIGNREGWEGWEVILARARRSV